MTMHEELVELQTQLSFQENTIDQLNNVVTQQQKEIDRLQISVRRLTDQMETILSHQEATDQQPPPHY